MEPLWRGGGCGDCRIGYRRGCSATGYGRNDAHFITVVEGGGLVVEETDVLAVHIHIEKTAQLAGLVAKAGFEAGIAAFEGIDQAVHAAGVERNAGLVVGELLKGSGDQNLNGHGSWMDRN